MDNLKAADALKLNVSALSERDKPFAESLLSQLERKGSLSDKQWYWVGKLADTAEKAKDGIPDFTTQMDVGDFSKVVAFFENAKKHLKYPKIRLQLSDGQPLALALMGNKAKYPGSINVSDGGPRHANTWFGRINFNGQWYTSRSARENPQLVIRLMTFLTELAANPAKVTAEYGKLTGHCCFCHSELTDERSKAVGYGKTCAEHYGLPWGDVPDMKEVA